MATTTDHGAALVRAGQAIELARRIAFTDSHPVVALADRAWESIPRDQRQAVLLPRFTSITGHERGYSTHFLIPECGPVEAHNLERGHVSRDGTRSFCLYCREDA